MRLWRSALRLLNSAIGGSKLSLSLGVRDGTGFYRFLCPGFDRRRTVGRPSHVSHPAAQCIPIVLAILAETERIDDSTHFTDIAATRCYCHERTHGCPGLPQTNRQLEPTASCATRSC